MLKKKKVGEVIEKLHEEYPDAGTMLHFGTIFQLVVAVVLSAQSTDDQVNRVSRRLFDYFADADALSKARLEDIEDLIRAVGLYHAKARHLIELAKVIEDRYQGTVPDTLEELMRLPGVGRKSANVIISVGFGKPGLGVDTHVQRVANRLGLVRSKNPTKTELELKKIIPQELWGKAHHLLIFHGRRVCKARKPECDACVLDDVCEKHLD